MQIRGVMMLTRLALLMSMLLAIRSGFADDRQSLRVGNATRTYIVRVPESSGSGARVPLVIDLHGARGNAESAEHMTGFTDKAKKEGFIVVYPDGGGRLRTTALTWNAGRCCGYAMRENVADVAFIAALIDHLVASYPIDEKRIYVTGMSNGGMMAHRLGIELSGRIAAIAPVMGTLFGAERKPAYPVAALMINGLLDKSIPIDEHTSSGNAGAGRLYKPVTYQGTFWARADGCADRPEEEETATLIHWHYQCPAGCAVDLLIVKDSGHAWPGGARGLISGVEPSQSLNATDVIWDFFKAHPLLR
jgi:polyhydroxybutyrate depolymerase